jgi:hypothetical protein
MSSKTVWRRKAIDWLPEILELQKPNLSRTIYEAFLWIKLAAFEAHAANDIDRLSRIYAFADYCATQQTSTNVGNAVWTVFYEHLMDDESAFRAIPEWIKPEFMPQLIDLFKWRRIDSAKLSNLIYQYNSMHKTQFEPTKQE